MFRRVLILHHPQQPASSAFSSERLRFIDSATITSAFSLLPSVWKLRAAAGWRERSSPWQAIIDGVGIDSNLIRSAKLSAIAKSIPHLAKSAEEAKRLISNQMQVAEQLVSSTELGNLLAAKTGAAKAPSGQAVNKQVAGCRIASAIGQEESSERS